MLAVAAPQASAGSNGDVSFHARALRSGDRCDRSTSRRDHRERKHATARPQSAALPDASRSGPVPALLAPTDLRPLQRRHPEPIPRRNARAYQPRRDRRARPADRDEGVVSASRSLRPAHRYRRLRKEHHVHHHRRSRGSSATDRHKHARHLSSRHDAYAYRQAPTRAVVTFRALRARSRRRAASKRNALRTRLAGSGTRLRDSRSPCTRMNGSPRTKAAPRAESASRRSPTIGTSSGSTRSRCSAGCGSARLSRATSRNLPRSSPTAAAASRAPSSSPSRPSAPCSRRPSRMA